MGGGLYQAHRRDHRGDEERGRAGDLGRPAAAAQRARVHRFRLSQRALPRRAEKASITYVDVWDGFVDEAGRFTPQGPDFQGQIRQLRANDGVYFTKAGARKLAHYVEREIERHLANRAVPVALPAPEPRRAAHPGAARQVRRQPTARPLAGRWCR